MFTFSVQVDFDTSAIHGFTLAWALSIEFRGWGIRDAFGFSDTERNASESRYGIILFSHAQCREVDRDAKRLS
jgi:hypothetical protein